ncbi:hypothetical protein AS850_00560 [Frondihabitans sp. 762G35]|uniref:hypothetical protein n=1 Tax=Frondihabitans sp. 762G35 TaxID=1446794 RepID=UPI000D2264B4|nr:hypothetical protein [Frondihabitans sp. 762G35]ARC55567.1 hypothetical protein AS850_00560 [Frondihabitans sp. 762G35]
MQGKLIFVAGAAIGYVLGSRAGHQRYKQISAGASKFWHSRPIQKQVDKASAAAGDIVPGIVVGLFNLTVWLVKKILGIQTKPRSTTARAGR